MATRVFYSLVFLIEEGNDSNLKFLIRMCSVYAIIYKDIEKFSLNINEIYLRTNNGQVEHYTLHIMDILRSPDMNDRQKMDKIIGNTNFELI